MAINPDKPLIPLKAASLERKPSPQAAAADASQPSLPADQLQASLPAKAQTPAILNFSALPEQAQYTKAVAGLQARVDADLALQDRSQKRNLYLRQNYQSQLLTQPQPSPKGTVIMLHGYTAGPWQYSEAAERFHQAGYQVYVPRIPGHGFMKPDGTPTGEKMVQPDNLQEYERFIDQTYAEVKALGGPVHVVGLSGGSNLALRMAEKYPDIKGVVAMTPYIGPDERVRVVNNVLNTVAEHSFVKLPQWLDFIPYNKNIRTIPNNPIPHTQGTLANAQAMFSIGTQVDKVKVPVQFFTTAGDLLSGTDPVRRLYERSGGDSKNGWEHFEAEAKVPHAMASPKQFEGAGQIWDQVFETIEQGVQPKRKP